MTNPIPTPLRRARLARLSAVPAVLAASAAAWTGCGGGGSEDADPARVAPQGSVVYISAAVRPEGDDKEAVDEISRKVFRVAEPGKRIQQELDQSFKDDPETRNVTYADDIEPWLGRRAGVAVTRLAGNQPQAALIIAAKDPGAASEAIERAAESQRPKPAERSYKDVDYRFDSQDSTAVGVVGDYFVAGSEPAFRSVIDASKAKGLSEKADFKDVSGEAEDKLGFGYVDVRALATALSASGQLPPGQGQTLQSLVGAGTRPVTFSLDAQPDRVTLESVARGVRRTPATAQPETPLVPALPGDSWLALGTPKVGDQLRQMTAQLGAGGLGEGVVSTLKQQLRVQAGLDFDRDLVPALGDVAFFARGTGQLTFGAGAVVQTPDPAAARRLVARLRPLLAREAGGGARVSSASVPGAQGFKITLGGVPGAINVVSGRDRLVIAYGEATTRAAFSSATRLGNSPAFREATDSLDGSQPGLFVAFSQLAQLLSSLGGGDAQRVSSYLRALETLAAGSELEGDTQTGRFVLTLK